MPDTMVPIKSSNGTAPRRADPFAWFDDFANDMEHFWARPFAWPFRMRARGTSAFVPRMDAYEKDHALVVKVELPGLKKEDVQVEVQADNLIIGGKAHGETEVKEEDYYRSERSFGSFYRVMQLPAGVAADQIQASLSDGVLEVRIPQPTQTPPATTKVPVN